MNLLSEFMSTPVKRNEIKSNERTKKIWDLDEKKGFKFYNIYHTSYGYNKIYGVRKELKNTCDEALMYLYYIDTFIQELINCIKNNKALAKIKNCINESIIIISTPYNLQEIPKGSIFNGLNKPKKIHWKNVNCDLNTFLDNNFLAGYRHIMLQIRTNDGKLVQWEGRNGIKKLIIHELSHTMCNHVTYRENGNKIKQKINGKIKNLYIPGNHEKEDFYKCEDFLKKIENKCKSIKLIEKNILQLTKK